MSKSTGKKVPLFDKNWEKNEERRVELWSDLWNSGKCSFEVSKRVLRKFESDTFREQFLSHLRAKGIEDPKIKVEGSKVTISGRREITKAEITEIAMGKGRY